MIVPVFDIQKTVVFLLALLILWPCFLSQYLNAQTTETEADTMWKAGISEVNITPENPMWMAGYAFRDRPAEGTLHDLWAKALALEDADGRRAVLVTADLLGFPKDLSDLIRDRVKETLGLSRAQILLNSSHTHAGPVLEGALEGIYPLDEHHQQLVKQYTRELEDQIVKLIKDAIDAMEPARLYAGNGIARFQVNRRNNDEATLSKKTELKGPNNFDVPVLKIENRAGEMMAIAFGYACHPTTLNNFKWSGDFPGFAQIELEKAYPGVTALFFQGAGADHNPMPRFTVPLAEQHGRTLAAAVRRILKEEMRELAPRLSTAYTEVDLHLSTPPSKEDFLILSEELTGYQQRWAARMYAKLEQGETLETSYPFPLQVWQLGDQVLMSLGGETVIEYAIQLKRLFGENTFVLGYSNDVMAYIPSTKILLEGGYEGEISQRVYGLPAKWAADIETVILREMIKLAKQAGVEVQVY